MATNLATAFVTIVPSLKGASKSIETALSGVNTESIGQKSGNKYSSGFNVSMGGLVKTAVGVLGGIASAKILQGGISRSLAIEQAQFKFKALGFDVEAVMASCNAAVDGTAYSLDAAATTASMLGASGVQAGDEMTRSLKAVAGVAAMGGAKMEEIGTIFGQVAAKGKLQGDELLQLSERGINATSALADHLGITQAEVREMVSAGLIDFQTFSDAMYATFGEAAAGANETFSGALSNMGSAINRLTAKFADPALGALKDIFNAMRPAINAVSTALDPLVTKFTEFCNAVSGEVVKALNAFTDTMNNGGNIIQGLAAAFGSLPVPVKLFATALAGIGAAKAVSGITSIGTSLVGLAPKFATATGNIIATGSKLPMVGGLFTTLGTKMNTLGSAVALCGGGFKGVAAVIGGALLSPVGIAVMAITALVGAFIYLWNTSETFRAQMQLIGNQIALSLQPAFETIKTTLQNLASTVMPLISNALNSVISVLGMVITAVLQVVAFVIPIVAQIFATIAPILAQLVIIIVQVASSILSTVIPVAQQIFSVIMQVLPPIMSIFQTVCLAIFAVIQAVFPVIKVIITAVMNNVLAVIQAVWPVIQAVITTVMNIIQAVIKTVTAAIKGDWSGVWEGIKEIFSSVWYGIVNILSACISAVGDLIAAGLNFVADLWTNNWNAICNFFSNAWDNMRTAASNGVQNVISEVQSLPDQIQSFFSNAGQWLVEAGGQILEGLKNGIMGAVTKVTGAISDAVGSVIEAGKNVLGIESPSKVFAEIGMYTIQGFANGITDNGGIAAKAMSGVMSDLSAEVEPYGDITTSSSLFTRSQFETSGAAAVEDIKAMLSSYLPELANMQLVTDTGVLAGELTPAINKNLGRITARKGRGL